MAVKAKLGKMRKEQDFSVMLTQEGHILAQSDKSIAQFNPETGKGLLNTKGSYFIHLNKSAGAEDYDFPQDFVDACKNKALKPGDEIVRGLGVFMGMAPISRLS